jgi:ribosome-associated protein
MAIDEDNDDGLGGRSRRRREARDAHFGKQLVEVKEPVLALISLPEEVRKAVLVGRGIKSYAARKRQIAFINKLLRDLEPEELAAIGKALEPPRRR